jgi:bis(5'-nucleosyl)-tetraphosphatase (symmetrical)
MVHAGVFPQWTADDVLARAAEVEAALCGPGYREFLRGMYGNGPDRWDASLEGPDRLRVIVNALTRMRFVTSDGAMDFHQKGPPGTQPVHLVPWFEVPGRKTADARIVCGHWSALGICVTDQIAALDSGCLWGGTLTALRLEDDCLFRCDCSQQPGTRPPR